MVRGLDKFKAILVIYHNTISEEQPVFGICRLPVLDLEQLKI